MISLLHAAVERGVTFFDAAEVYGPLGNEELVGEALAPFRGKLVIATKFGWQANANEGGKWNALNTDDPPRPRSSACRSVAERILDFLARTRKDGDAHIGSARNWIRSVQPAGQRLPDRQDRRRHEVRYHGLPQQRATVQRRESQSEPALVDVIRSFAEQRKVTPAQVALAWLLAKKPWIVPIPGTTKVARLEENLGAATVELTPRDVSALEDASSKIKLEGARYPAFHAKLVGR